MFQSWDSIKTGLNLSKSDLEPTHGIMLSTNTIQMSVQKTLNGPIKSSFISTNKCHHREMVEAPPLQATPPSPGRRFSRGLTVTRYRACLTVWKEIRQTRAALVSRREATDFCGASPARVCVRAHVCALQQGCVRVAGGRMVILSPQMDRKRPGGI